MSKNKIQNYIILEFLKNYATLLFIFSLVIWLMQSVRLLDLIYQDGNTFFVYIKYIIFQFPKIVSKTSIIIFFIAIFLTLNNLEDSNEIKNSSFFGVNPKTLFFKYLKYSLIFALILIIFKTFIIPYFSKKSRTLLLDGGIGSFSNLIKENNFNNPSRRTTIYVEEKNKIGELKNIIIFQEEDIGSSKVIIAKNGIVAKIKNESYFITEKGIIQELNPYGNITQISFDKTTTDIKNFKKKSADYYKFNEFSFIELLRLYLLTEKMKNRSGPASEILDRILSPLVLPTLLLTLGCLFIDRELSINRKKLKIYLFLVGFLIIFLLEFLISYSQKNIFFSYLAIIYIFLIFFLSFYISNLTFKDTNVKPIK